MSRRKRLSKGIRKYLRKEKARIRLEIHNMADQKKRIEELIMQIGKK
ncbi:hypothetical protein KKG41_06525 [Patescibacteria group bacterium]|nr:hypothetical protein [Patescibacteria group bacterium]MBU1891034.1 hypothetical protein [Patescibacteria group bacterium]